MIFQPAATIIPTRRGKLVEFAALVLVVMCAVAFPLVPGDRGNSAIVDIYMNAAHGDMRGFYYPNWVLPFWLVLSWLPKPVPYIIHNLINVAGIYYAAGVFGGSRARIWVSFPMLALLWYGNVAGFVGTGIAWMFVSLEQRRWWRASAAWTLVMTKPQLALAVGVPMLLRARAVRRDAWPLLVVPTVVGVTSLFIWPLWPLVWLERMQSAPPDAWGSMTLWRYLGPFALLAWLPLPFARHFPRRKFLTFTLAATMLSLPYLQSTGVLHLLVHPIGWAGWLAQVGWLFGAVGTLALRLTVAVPLAVYARLLLDLLSDLDSRGLIPLRPSPAENG